MICWNINQIRFWPMWQFMSHYTTLSNIIMLDNLHQNLRYKTSLITFCRVVKVNMQWSGRYLRTWEQMGNREIDNVFLFLCQLWEYLSFYIVFILGLESLRPKLRKNSVNPPTSCFQKNTQNFENSENVTGEFLIFLHFCSLWTKILSF